MKALIALLMMLLLTCTAWAQNKQVRDRYGNLVETWSQQGSSTDVRGRDGTLNEVRTQRGDTIEVRDRNGRLLRTERVGK